MKVTVFRDEIQKLSVDELKQKIEETRRELFSLGLNKTTTHIKDYSLFKKMRRDIARMLTMVQNKKSSFTEKR